MSDHKFYHLSCYHPDGRKIPVAVWDGIRDYENIPPPGLFEHTQMYGRVMIVQVRSRHDAKAVKQTLSALTESFDSIVFWARSHEVYESLKQTLFLISNRDRHGNPRSSTPN